MHRHIDDTQDWMDDVIEIVDKFSANKKLLQSLPPEDIVKEKTYPLALNDLEEKPNQTVEERNFEDKRDVSEGVLKSQDIEKLNEENKNLIKEFVVSKV